MQFYTHTSSRLQMFFTIGVLINFAIFTGTHLCWSLFLIKLQAWWRLSGVLSLTLIFFFLIFFFTYFILIWLDNSSDANTGRTSHLVLVFLLLTLSRWMPAGIRMKPPWRMGFEWTLHDGWDSNESSMTAGIQMKAPWRVFDRHLNTSFFKKFLLS